MSAHAARALAATPAPLRLALLGTGTVGRAFLARLPALRLESDAALQLSLVRNSRREWHASAGLDPRRVQDALQHAAAGTLAPVDSALESAFAPNGHAVVVDATASDTLAARHPAWLARGWHVITACKLGQGGPLERWRALRAVRDRQAHYGDAATVGAGLPLLRTLRALRGGGDRIHALAGVLSGSLGWLFSTWDGDTPFSQLLREARALGYTEPDPRDDLCGADVARKLLILVRSAGVELDAADIRIESLLPSSLQLLTRDEALGAFERLDVPLRARLREARRCGRVLRHVARWDAEGARVALEALAPDDPLAAAGGCDNRIALWSDRYRARPLVIQGPGAGADVTAAALCDDLAELALRLR